MTTMTTLLSRRIPTRKTDSEKDRSAADNLEAGASSPRTSSSSAEHAKSPTRARAGKSSDNDVLFVVRKSSLRLIIPILFMCSLMVMWANNLSAQQQQEEQQQRERALLKSVRVPASTKWLFKKPPTLREMYDLRNCESYLATYDEDGKRIDSKSLPIYTDEQWAYFRKIWSAQGGQDPSKEYKENDRRRSRAPPDLVPPFKAGQTKDGKGRGVFATRDIKKGEMTYGGTKSYIFFTTGHDYRRFLDALDDETACDLMKFTWPQKNVGPKHEPLIWGPMDDNAFMNDGGKERANTGCPPDKHCGNVRRLHLVFVISIV